MTVPALSLAEFETIFQEFLLGEYHLRQHSELPIPPQTRWEAHGFLPRLPESLEQLDLLLLTVAKSRLVRRDVIHFQGMCYLDPTLSAYVEESVVIRYDPRDMAEIRIYHDNAFLCQAVCQELAGQTISLKEIIRSRTRRRRELRGAIQERSAVVQTYLGTGSKKTSLPAPSLPGVPGEPPARRLKLYENE